MHTRTCQRCDGSGIPPNGGDCCGPCGGRGYVPCDPPAIAFSTIAEPTPETLKALETMAQLAIRNR